jgi:hypothetical protein
LAFAEISTATRPPHLTPCTIAIRVRVISDSVFDQLGAQLRSLGSFRLRTCARRLRRPLGP